MAPSVRAKWGCVQMRSIVGAWSRHQPGNEHPRPALAGWGLEEASSYQHPPLPPWSTRSAGPHKEVSCIITCLPPVSILAGVFPGNREAMQACIHCTRKTSGSLQPHGHEQSCIGTRNADEPSHFASVRRAPIDQQNQECRVGRDAVV